VGQAFLLSVLALGVGCGENVLVGNWQLRRLVDAGLGPVDEVGADVDAGLGSVDEVGADVDADAGVSEQAAAADDARKDARRHAKDGRDKSH
jgi:hypothetical protein